MPVISKIGEQFAARVSASLLKAVGLSDLIVYSEIEYEDLIVELALDKKRLGSIKARLTKNSRIQTI